jgi:hypothetical protein
MGGDDDSGLGLCSKVQVTLSPGTYQVRAYGYNNSTFSATIRVDNVTAMSVNVAPTTKYMNSKPYFEYYIAINDAGQYKFETSAYSSGSDTFLILYDTSHYQIAYNDDINASTGSYYSKVEQYLQPSWYYVKVRNYDATANVYATLNVSKTGAGSGQPYASITNLPYSGYFFATGSTNIAATVTGDSSPKAYYRDEYRGNMTYNSSTGKYEINLANVWRRPYYNSYGQWFMSKIKVGANNTAGHDYSERPDYVTMWSSTNDYKTVDPNFTYTSSTSNKFINVGTGHANAYGSDGTYNCLAFAVGITDHWEWPLSWGVIMPTYSQASTYMSGKGYATGSTSVLPWTKVIFYSNSHVAKVTAYDSNGYPTKIQSKWGGLEVVESDGYNPFTATYGNAVYFFK